MAGSSGGACPEMLISADESFAGLDILARAALEGAVVWRGLLFMEIPADDMYWGFGTVHKTRDGHYGRANRILSDALSSVLGREVHVYGVESSFDEQGQERTILTAWTRENNQV